MDEYSITSMNRKISEITSKDWLEFYKKTHNDKKFFAEKAWETIKLHILLSSSLISITIGTLALMHTSEVFLGFGTNEKSMLIAPLFILPFTMASILYIGSRNFDRECRRMYEQASIMMKLEEKFGFSVEEREEERKQFLEDKTYVPERYSEKIWNSSSEFIKDVMSAKDTLHGNMRRIFDIFFWVSVLLMILIWVVILAHQAGFF